MPTGSPSTQFQIINQDGAISYVIDGGNSPTLTISLGDLEIVLDQENNSIDINGDVFINGSPPGGGAPSIATASVNGSATNIAAPDFTGSLNSLGPRAVTLDGDGQFVFPDPAPGQTDIWELTLTFSTRPTSGTPPYNVQGVAYAQTFDIVDGLSTFIGVSSILFPGGNTYVHFIQVHDNGGAVDFDYTTTIVAKLLITI